MILHNRLSKRRASLFAHPLGIERSVATYASRTLKRIKSIFDIHMRSIITKKKNLHLDTY